MHQLMHGEAAKQLGRTSMANSCIKRWFSASLVPRRLPPLWVDTCPWHPGFPPSAVRSLNGPSSTLPRFKSVTDETCQKRNFHSASAYPGLMAHSVQLRGDAHS